MTEIKIGKFNKPHRLNDKGAALVVVIAIILVLMILCLSLILTAGTYFQSSQKGLVGLQTQETAVSISKEIEKELTTPSHTNYGQESTARSNGTEALWVYIRDNLNNASWPYYAEAGNKQGIETSGHSAAEAFRYFDMEATGVSESLINNGLTIYMYWKPASKADSEDADNEHPEGRLLYVTVTSERDGGMYSVTSIYKLRRGTDYTDASLTDAQKQNWKWELKNRE